jgi:hypothetical protein
LAAFISGVGGSAVDRVLPSAPPSSFPARGRRRPKRYSVWAAGLECWADLMGFGQVSPSSLFFSSFVSFLFSFCFADLKTLILIPLSSAGFELETSYQI